MEEQKIAMPEAVQEVAENQEVLAVDTAETQQIQVQEESLADRVRIISPGRLVLKRFFRSKLSMIGLVMLIGLFLFCFLGPLFTPWGETEVDYTPKQTITSTEVKYTLDDGSQQTVTILQYETIDINIYAPPSKSHLLGTDDKGMDVLARLMYGGRVSLEIGFIVVFATMLIGVVLGGLAGYFGKWVDQLIMRIVDVFSCIPTLPILIISSAVLNAWGVEGKQQIYYLMIFMTVFSWSGTARLVRGQILMLREQEYMVAEEALGMPASRKIFKHLIPNVLPQLIVSMTLSLGGIILYEASLSFLGIGVPMPYAAWGSMINAANSRNILSNYPNMWAPPGICILIAVLAFNFIGDGLRDAFDPKMKR